MWQSMGKKDCQHQRLQKYPKWSTFVSFSTKQYAVLNNLGTIWMRIGLIIGFESPFQEETFSDFFDKLVR